MTTQNAEPRTRLHHGPRFEVYGLSVPARTGAPVRREVVVAPDAAVILPLLNAHTIVMIRNKRFAVDQTLWELPAGTVEPGEDPQTCAARELTEETGYRAAQLTPMTRFYPSPGICTEQMHAFVARNLEAVGQNLDPTETITPEPVPLHQALQRIRDHVIRDGKTIAALLYYHCFVAK